MRKFEKISFEQFKKDVEDNKELYETYSLPRRKTKKSAAYDINALIDYELKPDETVLIPTGVKCTFPDDEMLMMVVRSSTGFKYNVRLVNQVGIFDADFYNNEGNEGHMMIKLHNHGKEIYSIKIGDSICQLIFTKYLTVDDEEEITNERKGGVGSTGKR